MVHSLEEVKPMLIGSLCSVTNFELKGFHTMAVLDEEFDEVPIFDNLRTLSLDSCFLDRSKSDARKFKALGRFLQKSPNLEKLTLKHFEAVLDEEFDEVPVFGNLRTLSLDSCFLDLNKSDVIRFKALGRFLQKSPNLESLTLRNFMVSRVVELVGYPTLESLRTLFVDMCDLHDNFGLLHYCLRNSPNLEKLTVRHCKLSDGSNGGEGNAKSKKTCSRSRKLVHFQCPKLKSTEIKQWCDQANIPELVRFVLEIAAPKNTITFSNT